MTVKRRVEQLEARPGATFDPDRPCIQMTDQELAALIAGPGGDWREVKARFEAMRDEELRAIIAEAESVKSEAAS